MRSPNQSHHFIQLDTLVVFQLRVAVLPDIIAVFVAVKVNVGEPATHHPRSESDEHRGVPFASNPVITPLPLQLFPVPVAGSPKAL